MISFSWIMIPFIIFTVIVVSIMITHAVEHNTNLEDKIERYIKYEFNSQMLNNIESELNDIMTEEWLDKFIERINKKQLE